MLGAAREAACRLDVSGIEVVASLKRDPQTASIPVLVWSGFITTLLFVMLCINTILPDIDGPVILLPPPVIAECSGGGNTVVNYPTVSAFDHCGGPALATCTPPSGSTFQIGVTTVTCRSADAAGNPVAATQAIKAAGYRIISKPPRPISFSR